LNQDDIKNDIYEIVIYYEEPVWQVIHVQAPSAEAAEGIIRDQASEHKLMNFRFERTQVINNENHIQ